jgi:hypothetical protein
MKKLLVALLFVPAMAQAEFRTGNQLLAEIQSTEVVERMLSLGYIMAIADNMRYINHCPPNTVTAGQLQDMVRIYLLNNPQTRHRTADVIIMEIMKQAWPCPRRGTGV